jgi:hypothetical protein
MYMPFQFFTLLATYSAWRGYVQNQGKFKLLAVLAIIAAVLSHQEGNVLIPTLIAATVTTMWVKEERWPSIFSLQNVATVLSLGAVSVLILIINPPSLPAIVIHDGILPDRVGLNLNPIYWGKHLFYLERTLPYGLALLPILYFKVFASEPFKLWSNLHHSIMYLIAVFTFSVLTLGFIIRDGGGERFFFFVLPIYALLVSARGIALIQFLTPNSDNGSKPGALIR